MTDHHEAEAHQGDDDWQPIGIFAAAIREELDRRRLRLHQVEETISGSIEGRAATGVAKARHAASRPADDGAVAIESRR